MDHGFLGSGKRPDISANICEKEVLFDVRTNTVTTGGYDSSIIMSPSVRSAATATDREFGGPLGDPSARVFGVFLIVLDGVQGGTLIVSHF